MIVERDKHLGIRMITVIRVVLLDLLFPPKCPFCRALLQAGDALCCELCQSTLPWLPGPQAETTGDFFTVCVAPLRYKDSVRDAVLRYKFNGLLAYAKPFGTLMAQCVEDHLAGQYDVITWVPLSRERRRKRGYDQAERLAQTMGQALGLCAEPLLVKIRHTGMQSRIEDPAARRANVLGAYQEINPTRIMNARILLVDDIATTGATLSECARMLRTAGATDVICVTFAKAGT